MHQVYQPLTQTANGKTITTTTTAAKKKTRINQIAQTANVALDKCMQHACHATIYATKLGLKNLLMYSYLIELLQVPDLSGQGFRPIQDGIF